MAHVVSSATTLALLTSMNEKCKSTMPGTIQVKDSADEKLAVAGWLVKSEQIVDIRHSVRLAHSSTCMICDSAW